MDPKLNQLTPVFRDKVETILKQLADKHMEPYIAEAKRTVAQQREKVNKGYSKTMRSNHLPGSDGLSRAADIVQLHKGWAASKRFWLMLGSSSWANQTGWGGLFGLNGKQKKSVQVAIHTLRQAGWPATHEAYQVQMGWDPAHVEMPVNWPKF